MKKNSIKFVIGGMLLLLATTSFAAVLDYYVKAQGVAQVSPPEFYIGSPLGEKLLIINEESSDCESFEIEGEYRTFKTKVLEGKSFTYLPDVNFRIRAKGSSNSTSTPVLQLGFGYYKTSDPGESNPIYLAKTEVTLSGAMRNYSLSPITASGKPQNIRQFFYEFKKLCPDCSYTISKCAGSFYTKVELSK